MTIVFARRTWKPPLSTRAPIYVCPRNSSSLFRVTLVVNIVVVVCPIPVYYKATGNPVLIPSGVQILSRWCQARTTAPPWNPYHYLSHLDNLFRFTISNTKKPRYWSILSKVRRWWCFGAKWGALVERVWRQRWWYNLDGNIICH